MDAYRTHFLICHRMKAKWQSLSGGEDKGRQVAGNRNSCMKHHFVNELVA